MTEEEIGALRLLDTYGDGLDLTGRRVGMAVKNVVKGLLFTGHMAGTLGNLSMTEKGREELAKHQGKQ